MAPKRKLEVADDSSNAIVQENYDPCRLFITNLNYSVTEKELTETFGEYGQLEEVHLLKDHIKRAPTGKAYIRFKDSQCAIRARNGLKFSLLKGRQMRIMQAMPREARGSRNTPMAVLRRSALGESEHDIAQSKAAFAEAGVNVTALERWSNGNCDNRSNNVLLLVKCPSPSTKKELNELFGQYGKVKVIINPKNSMALFVFGAPDDAKKAYDALAFGMYKNAQLFIEWAPKDILVGAERAAAPWPKARANQTPDASKKKAKK